MDGLSVAGSVAGLVAIADLIVIRGRKYVLTMAHAKSEVKTLVDETAN